MTDKEFKRLKRADLLEIIFCLQQEVERLKQENAALRQNVQEMTQAAMQMHIPEEAMQRICKEIREAVLASRQEQPGAVPDPESDMVQPGAVPDPESDMVQPGVVPDPESDMVQPGAVPDPESDMVQPGVVPDPESDMVQKGSPHAD